MDPLNAHSSTDFEDDYPENLQGDPEGLGAAAQQQTSLEQEGYEGDPNEQEEEEESTTPPFSDPANPITAFYDSLGFEDGRLLLDDQEVNFNTLTPEQRAEVITDRLEHERELGRQEAVERLGLTDEEKLVINHLRTNGTLDGFVSDAPVGVAAMTHDDLHRANILALDPNASEQEIAESLAARRSTTGFVRQAETIRSQLINNQQAQAQASQEAEYASYVTEVSQAVSSIKKLGNVPISPAHQQFILEQLTARAEGSAAAPFIAALADPARLSEYAGKALLFDSMVQGFQELLGTQKIKTVDEILGRNRPRTVQQNGAAPVGRNRPTNGSFSNQDLDETI